MLLQFPVFIEPYTQKPLPLHHLGTVPVPIKHNNTEANSYTWLQPRNDYLAMTEENYISLTSDIGHEYFCETIFLVKHETSQS